MKKKVLVTGAGGFVGSALVEHLASSRGCPVVGCVRRASPGLGFQPFETGDLVEFDRWGEALENVDVVVHLAARAHVLKEQTGNALARFRQVNVDVTARLAEAALRAGAKRFLYISSVGVNGAATPAGPFSEDMDPAPESDYAISKLEAEEKLKSLFAGTDMELVIVRPPLVYSGKAPGNFRRLLQLSGIGLPLPFAGVSNQRSMLALDNLVDFLDCCIHHENAAGQTFLVADSDALSLPEIITAIGSGMNRKVRLFAVPVKALSLAAALVGKRSEFNQLCVSLVVDVRKAHEMLGWQPPVLARPALAEAGREYLESL